MSDGDLTADEDEVILSMMQGKGCPDALRGLLPALAMRGLVRRIGPPFDGYLLESAGHTYASARLGYEWKSDVRVDVDAFLDGATQPRNFLAERLEAAKPNILRALSEGQTITEVARIFFFSRRDIDSIARAEEFRRRTETKDAP